MIKADQWPWPIPQAGVYFTMPFADYLDIRCLNNSGIKDLLVSGPNFWKNSWMNPFRKTRNTLAFTTGRHYHKRVLEGREAFYAAYAPDWDDDYTDATILRSGGDIKLALARLGQPTSFKTNAEGAARLMKVNPAARIADVLRQKHRAQFPDKEYIPADLVREIELGAKAIECNPHLNHWLMGGFPEVTVIFYDPVLGLWFKIRFDYLKIKAAADLKSIANKALRDFEKAVDYEFAGNKYMIQSSLYLRGAEAARALIDGGHVFGAEEAGVSKDWLELFAKTPVEEFRFIFHQKDFALCTEGRIHSVHNKVLQDQGQARLIKGAERFHRYMKMFGPDEIWISNNPAQHIDYASLPAFVNDL